MSEEAFGLIVEDSIDRLRDPKCFVESLRLNDIDHQGIIWASERIAELEEEIAELKGLENLVALEVPHLKYIIDSFESQGIYDRTLREIYGNLLHQKQVRKGYRL